MKRYSIKNQMLQILVVFCLSMMESYGQSLHIIPVGHSHNDYTRDVPMHDALTYGFTSIEADVYLHEGRMVVTHDAMRLNEKPTLQALYLDPLKSFIQTNGGRVFPGSNQKLVLMVDLKSDKVETYHALKEIVADYKDMIEWYQGDDKVDGAIRILLTGGPPTDIIEKEQDRYFYVDWINVDDLKGFSTFFIQYIANGNRP